jgi:type VI protein secretion system component Hcp
MPEKMVNNSYALAQFTINGNSGGAGEICFSNPEDTRSGTPTCYLKYNFERVFIKSWSTSGDADDRPTEEVAFYYNKIAFGQQSEVP